MPETITMLRSSAAGMASAGAQHWPSVLDLAEPSLGDLADQTVHWVVGLMNLSEELPSMTLGGQLSAANLAAFTLYHDVSDPPWQGVVAGTLTGAIESPIVGTGTDDSEAQTWTDEQLSFYAAGTSGFGAQWLTSVAVTVPEAFPPAVAQKPTWGTLVTEVPPDPTVRLLHRWAFGYRVTADEDPQMESDYPNLVRALRSGLLDQLDAPVAPRVPRPPEEPSDVGVPRQLSFGTTGDPPTAGWQRRSPLLGLFDN